MKRAGFMLIELAVASFVIGVAVLALVAVLHVGQRAATEGDAATRTALFADDALATLRLLNDRAAADPDPETWADLWRQLDPEESGGTVITQLTGFASDVWEPDQTGDLPCLDTSPGVHTNFWCPARLGRVLGDATRLVRADYAIRYSFSFKAGEDMDLGERMEPRYYAVTLLVWYGTSVNAEADNSFFAIFTNPGRLP